MTRKKKEKGKMSEYSTKKDEKRIGLGLSVVYGIIQRHNGSIDVQSEKNTGTNQKAYQDIIYNGTKSIHIIGKTPSNFELSSPQPQSSFSSIIVDISSNVSTTASGFTIILRKSIL